jgi:protein-tyrosine phosphatase
MYPRMSTAELPRTIPLVNASNLRDLGGYPAADGRHVRRGLLFRAPALVALTDSDIAAIAALGLRTTCDFRGVREREVNPVILAGAHAVPLPIEPSVGAGLRDILRTGLATGHVTPEEMLDLLREAYQAYALQSFDRYRALFDLLRDDANLPLLFHCSAGKDRTGFGAALLLTALGVSWDHVMHDYLATNRLWRREIARNFDLPQPVKDTLLGAHATLLTAAFDAVRGAYGSVDAYLERALGLDAAARAGLADRLLEA